MAESLEKVLMEQCKKLEELQTATTLICNKELVRSDLIAMQADVASLRGGVNAACADLEKMKQSTEAMKKLLMMLEKLKSRILHMGGNIPPQLLQDYAKINERQNPSIESLKSEASNGAAKSEDSLSDNVFEEPIENRVQNCKKTLFSESEVFPMLKLLGQEEFQLIPKYMIGRQSLDAVNQFLATINEILKAKYSLLALGKNGARKKGELDLYLAYQKQEITDGKNHGKVYFFTAEDYHRHTKQKMDKTRLNLLTVLSHCKRLRRIHTAKAIQYAVITNSL